MSSQEMLWNKAALSLELHRYAPGISGSRAE
jgi:hypothetical protein